MPDDRFEERAILQIQGRELVDETGIGRRGFTDEEVEQLRRNPLRPLCL